MEGRESLLVPVVSQTTAPNAAQVEVVPTAAAADIRRPSAPHGPRDVVPDTVIALAAAIGGYDGAATGGGVSVYGVSVDASQTSDGGGWGSRGAAGVQREGEW